jgi:hypothetical protein
MRLVGSAARFAAPARRFSAHDRSTGAASFIGMRSSDIPESPHRDREHGTKGRVLAIARRRRVL